MRKFIQKAALGALTLAAMATIGTASAVAKTLTLSTWVPATHFIHTDFIMPFAQKVEEATNGRVTINVLPAPLGSPPQHWELARMGVADITWGNFTYEPERFKTIWFAEFPNAGTNAEVQSRALWRTFEKYLADQPAYAGVKLLAVGMLGGGQLHHGSKTILSPDDIANQKFRMGGPIQEKLLSALGAVPVAAPAPKAYEMLDANVIDGSLHPMESIVNFRLEESLPHHTIFPNGLYDGTFFFAMNKEKWDGLSEEDKAAIDSISGEALSAIWGRNFDAQSKSATDKLMAAGHDFVEASPELVAAVDKVFGSMVTDWIRSAQSAGLEDPKAVLDFYTKTYHDLADK